jgi:hypothetical protein
VLEAAVLDGAQQLGLEQEVLEAGRVDAHVALLHLIARLARLLLGDLLLLVVHELLLAVEGGIRGSHGGPGEEAHCLSSVAWRNGAGGPGNEWSANEGEERRESFPLHSSAGRTWVEPHHSHSRSLTEDPKLRSAQLE